MWRVVVWVSMVWLIACGKTHESQPDIDGSAGNGGAAGEPRSTAGQGGSGLGGAAGEVSFAGAGGARELGCDEGWSGYFGCSTAYICQEPESSFAESAVRALCLPELGVTPVDGPCPTYASFVGRCYDPSNEYWTYHYNDADAAASCAGSDQVYCENPHGVPAALVETCRTACAEAAPDYVYAPECEGTKDYCLAYCFEAISGLVPSCAECVVASITWDEGYCVDFECVCPAPEFVASSAPECVTSCE